jgi:UDP-N-acetylmuramate--alanine ligase
MMTTHGTTTGFTLDPTRRHHFIAIGGIGMSALAQILLARGVRVSGSDMAASALLDKLAALGAEVHVGHDAAHVRPGDVVVLSDAVKADNVERRRAEALGCPLHLRADVLGWLANSGRGVAVSGTHGKTTTSGMLSQILCEAGLNPTCVLGGELTYLGGNARPGGDLTVVEACEAYDSFLGLHPEAALVTNIEADHLDHHGTFEHLLESFRTFLRQTRGVAVLNGDDAYLPAMAGLAPRTVCYGTGAGHAWRGVEVRVGREAGFTLLHHGVPVGAFTLQVPGLHNVHNAIGAAALALELGADVAAVQRALAAFPGMHRRFERLGVLGGVAVVDDYAHHPTEIRATLAAARTVFPGRVVAIFQPHLYSRTRDLLDDFATAFGDADVVFIAPIYQARETPIDGVDHTQLVARITALAPEVPAHALHSLEEGVRILTHAVRGAGEGAHAPTLPPLGDGDVMITLGAGDVDSLAHALLATDG